MRRGTAGGSRAAQARRPTSERPYWSKAYVALRAAAGHMQAIADPLADAIVKQFPDRFAS